MLHRISLALPSKARKALQCLVRLPALPLSPSTTTMHQHHMSCSSPSTPCCFQALFSVSGKPFLLPYTWWTQMHSLILIFLYRVVSAFQNWINHCPLWAAAVTHTIAPLLLHPRLLLMSSFFPLDCEYLRAGTESYSSLYHQLLARGHNVHIK